MTTTNPTAREDDKAIHTEACWAMPECTVCGLRKKPWGRDAGLEAASSYCDSDCPGYNPGEQPGHFWPGEKAEDEETNY